MFPRLAIHTGTLIDLENSRPHWSGTIVLQYNETTATILKYGPDMKKAAKKRHPLLSTFQSNCEASYWGAYDDTNHESLESDVWYSFFGQEVKDGQVVVPVPTVAVVGVQPPVAHGGPPTTPVQEDCGCDCHCN